METVVFVAGSLDRRVRERVIVRSTAASTSSSRVTASGSGSGHTAGGVHADAVEVRAMLDTLRHLDADLVDVLTVDPSRTS
ncbi:hypothetical protein RYH80_19865 [Halobaculum sp. MBLA0147]|uniref:hypothetical protein n=1 Tax=Halobaculum sp. MBLA0147 TaxID=3079934 RepID=UPI00352368EA